MRLKAYNLGEREDVGENSRQSRERKRYRIKKKRVYITKKGEVHSLREKNLGQGTILQRKGTGKEERN